MFGCVALFFMPWNIPLPWASVPYRSKNRLCRRNIRADTRIDRKKDLVCFTKLRPSTPRSETLYNWFYTAIVHTQPNVLLEVSDIHRPQESYEIYHLATLQFSCRNPLITVESITVSNNGQRRDLSKKWHPCYVRREYVLQLCVCFYASNGAEEISYTYHLLFQRSRLSIIQSWRSDRFACNFI